VKEENPLHEQVLGIVSDPRQLNPLPKRPLSGRPQVPPWIAQGLFVKGCRGAKLNIQNFSITLHKTTYPFCSNSNSYKTETKHQSSAVTSANPRLNVRSETAEGACPSCSTHGC